MKQDKLRKLNEIQRCRALLHNLSGFENNLRFEFLNSYHTRFLR